jgi:hypothetical protein
MYSDQMSSSEKKTVDKIPKCFGGRLAFAARRPRVMTSRADPRLSRSVADPARRWQSRDAPLFLKPTAIAG